MSEGAGILIQARQHTHSLAPTERAAAMSSHHSPARIANVVASSAGRTIPTDGDVELAQKVTDALHVELETVSAMESLEDGSAVLDDEWIIWVKFTRGGQTVWSSIQLQEDTSSGGVLDRGPISLLWTPPED